MKAPRYAHWLVVPALVTGMGLGPLASAAAPPAKPPVKVPAEDAEAEPEDEPSAVAPEGEPSEATEPTTEPEPAAEPEPATEPEPAPEPELAPRITVQPQPITALPETTPAPGEVPRSEVVDDPRRLRSDERILVRAGLLSLGIAGAALVPTVIGFQQASVADREGLHDHARTMTNLGIGASVVAGTYAITGTVLVLLGRRRAERRTEVAPAVGPGQVGAVLRARF